LNTIVYRAPHSYSSHPCITKVNDGDWLVAFCASPQHQPPLHPPDNPHFHNLIIRSRDQGQTWDLPRVVPNYDWYGVETPGIAQLTNGNVLLNQWRFLWYPLELARELASTGQEKIFVLNPARHVWQMPETEEDWSVHPYPYARADGGAFVHISTNNGATWQHTIRLDIAPYQAAFSPKGATQLSDGTTILALGSHDHDPYGASFILRSPDFGLHWSKPIEAARMSGRVFAEPSVVATESDKLLLFTREEVTGYIYQSESRDLGLTWTPAHLLQIWGHPTHAVRLIDGRIFIVYGYRRPPYGIRGAVSEDEGRSWGNEIVIRDNLFDSNRGFNLGYPSVIEYVRGKLFAVYYAEDTKGVVCIQGSYFSI